MSFCPNCGNQLRDNMNFCPVCGKKVQLKSIGRNAGESHAPSGMENRSQAPVSPLIGFMNNAKNAVISAGVPPKLSNEKSVSNTGFTEKQPSSLPERVSVNCPNCGAPVDSMASRCKSCGSELFLKTQASACRELCNRLDRIEASRPKETLVSFVTGLANTALKKNKLTPTDQQKIELISNFVIPNTKADIMEFLFLAKTRIESCKKFSSSTDEYVAMVQRELYNVWTIKYEQTIEKAKIVLSDDQDFRRFFVKQLRENYRNENRCQYCGGNFKGLINRICSKCGRPKDY